MMEGFGFILNNTNFPAFRRKSVEYWEASQYFLCFPKLNLFLFCLLSESHDSRGSGGRSKEWSDFKTFGERVRFDLMASPSSLILERLRAEDAGLYRCRVDFKKSPTRNARANLSVISEYILQLRINITFMYFYLLL